MLNKKYSFENTSPPSPSVIPHIPTQKMEENVDSEYIYVTEELSSYPNFYTTEWDELFENIKAPMCDDISSYFFNPLKPLLPLHVLIPHQPQNINVSNNNIDSSELMLDESNDQIMVTPLTPNVGGEFPTLPSSTTTNHIDEAEISNGKRLTIDSSVKQRKRERLSEENSLVTSSEVNQPPHKRQQFSKST